MNYIDIKDLIKMSSHMFRGKNKVKLLVFIYSTVLAQEILQEK